MEKDILLILEPFAPRFTERMKAAAGENIRVVQLMERYADDELRSSLLNARIVVGQPPIELLQKPEETCPKLRMIQMTWAGTDQYTRSTLPFPKDRIRLANGSGAYGNIMSQYVCGMILTAMLNFRTYYDQQQAQLWKRAGRAKSLDGAKVLIFGAGDIGCAVAKRLSGFDTYNIGVCRNKELLRDYFDELCTLSEAEKYLPEADVVVGCIPNSEETQGYLNKDRLKLVKDGAVIVNVGRGNFIDCDALNEELDNGHLWGAALDVTNPEPLPGGHPLWDNHRCMITPHTSGATFGHNECVEDELCNIICDNISRFINGEELRNRIF